MTLRLIALMSIVLALCMGAFALIANSYHQQVMDEAGRIASESAKAVFGSLEGSSRTADASATRDRPLRPAGGAGAPSTTLTIVGDVDPRATRKLIEEVTRRRLAAPAGSDDERVEWIVDPSASPEHATFSAVGRFSTVQCRTGETGEECVETERDFPLTGEAHTQMFVRVEDIHARTQPEGVILTIPTLMPDPTALAAERSDDETIDAQFGEIRLPIPVEQYDRLFAGARRRSLLLFCGVFAVGVVLSAGAAARFTRPARRLDAALRELSDGDLDTEVAVRGHDEMARLGSAFNEMTRKLRANRDRAREMIRRDKLSALGRLAAGVAHDVRNPLHSIGLTLDHLNDTGRPENPERAAEFDRSLTVIRGEIRRLDQLVVNFLRFANGDRRERESVDLKALVEETARLIGKEAEWRGIEMKLDLEEVPEVRVDVESIRSSLLNLVLNSCEAMEGGGVLTVSLRREGEAVTLEVGDTGRGIEAEDQEKVFDFGYSTREGGSGLGLVMVHQCVVEDHGGHVSLESEPGAGTRVKLSLPLGAEESA